MPQGFGIVAHSHCCNLLNLCCQVNQGFHLVLCIGNNMGMGNPHGLWVEPIMGMDVGRDFSTHEFYKSLVLPKIIMH